MREYDYAMLLGKIKEQRYTQESLAKAVGISAASMNLKLNNKAYFRQQEITRMCEVLRIPTKAVDAYFFTLKPEKTQV